MHDRLWVYLDDGFGGRWAVAQRTVGTFRVVVFPPFFDQDLGFAQAVEDFAVQELVPEAGIEAFAVSVLPRAAWFDVRSLCADRLNPILHSLPPKTSTCRNFVTISSGFSRLLAMGFLRFPKHSGGPLKWGEDQPVTRSQQKIT